MVFPVPLTRLCASRRTEVAQVDHETKGLVMDVSELALTAVRAFAIYVVMLIVVRALGKRTVGNFAAFDLLVALMLGELIDEIIYADVSFLEGVVAIAVIGSAQAGNAWLSWWSDGFSKLTEGSPTVIVRDGQLQRDGMRSERMNAKDVMAHIRSEGIDDIRAVSLALVEDDGTVSVLKRSWAEAASMAEVDRSEAACRHRDTDGGRPATADERTDSEQWLT